VIRWEKASSVNLTAEPKNGSAHPPDGKGEKILATQGKGESPVLREKQANAVGKKKKKEKSHEGRQEKGGDPPCFGGEKKTDGTRPLARGGEEPRFLHGGGKQERGLPQTAMTKKVPRGPACSQKKKEEGP